MRVHPSQLKHPLQIGERLPLLAGITTLSLLLVLGSAFFGQHLTFPSSGRSRELAVVLRANGKNIHLFTAKSKSDGHPELTPLERAFLTEVASLGDLLYIPAVETEHLPPLETKSVRALKLILGSSSLDEAYSTIFSPGAPYIYRIDRNGNISRNAKPEEH